MKTLEEMVKEADKNKALLKEKKSLSSITDPFLYRSKKGHISRAESDLEDIFNKYRDAIRDRSVFIVTTGEKSKDFNNVASKHYGCFLVDAVQMYNLVLDEVPTQLYENTNSSPSLFSYYNDKFEDLASEIGVASYPSMQFDSKYNKPLKNRDDALEIIIDAFNEYVGAEMVGLYAMHVVAKQALDEGFIGKTVPIIIHAENKKLAQQLNLELKRLSENVFLKEINEEFTKENIEKLLLKIKKEIKK